MRRKNSAIVVLFACALLNFAPSVHAQKASDKADTLPAGLTQTVNLDLSGVTVKQALAELSAQCKIQIVPADYLEDRTLSLHLQRISASDALDTIAEGNDWIWYAENETTIRVRRRVPSPRSLAEVPAAFRAALPKDIRRYLGYDITPSDLLSDEDRKTFEGDVKPDKKNPRDLERFKQFEDEVSGLNVLSNLMQRFHKVRMKQQQIFERMLTDEKRDSIKIPYPQLTAEQKQTLINVMVCAALEHFCWDQSAFHFLHKPVPPEMLDPTKTVIAVKDNRIQVGPMIDGRLYGYDEGIQGPRALGDPLRLDPNRY